MISDAKESRKHLLRTLVSRIRENHTVAEGTKTNGNKVVIVKVSTERSAWEATASAWCMNVLSAGEKLNSKNLNSLTMVFQLQREKSRKQTCLVPESVPLVKYSLGQDSAHCDLKPKSSFLPAYVRLGTISPLLL